MSEAFSQKSADLIDQGRALFGGQRLFGEAAVQALEERMREQGIESPAEALYDYLQSGEAFDLQGYLPDEVGRSLIRPPQQSQDQVTDEQSAQVAQEPEKTGSSEPTDLAAGEVVCHECGKTMSGVTGLKRHLTRTHKMTWASYCGKYGVDDATGSKLEDQKAKQQAQTPNAPPPEPLVTAPPTLPSAPASVVVPDPPAPQQAPPAPQQAPPAPQQAPSAPQQAPPAPQQAPPVQSGPTLLSRAEMAARLGGEVWLYVVRLDDLASSQVPDGYVDANQLGKLATQMVCEQHGWHILAQDPNDFGRSKQYKQRKFSELLTMYPHVFLLRDGYTSLIDDDLFSVLMARVTLCQQVIKGQLYQLQLPQ